MDKSFTKSLRFKSLKVARLFVLTVLPVVVLALISNEGWSQNRSQTRVHNAAQRPNRNIPAQEEKPIEKPIVATALTVDPASPLGQALDACGKIAEESGSFALPGLKGDVALDRCYKGRDHLVCVFNAVISEEKSLIDSYTKIVEAKYPELSSVDNICKLKRDALGSDIAGAEDFTKRFAVVKSQYESGSKCAANVKQAFHDVVLADMTQPPDILKSMADSIDVDINRMSQVENEIADLAEKMQASAKAMKTIEKIHKAMCMKENVVRQDKTN